MVKCNLKLAERLAQHEEKTKGVKLLLEEYLGSFTGLMVIGGVMIACGGGILGYFGGRHMTIGDIMAVGEIGAINGLWCCVFYE